MYIAAETSRMVQITQNNFVNGLFVASVSSLHAQYVHNFTMFVLTKKRRTVVFVTLKFELEGRRLAELVALPCSRELRPAPPHFDLLRYFE